MYVISFVVENSLLLSSVPKLTEFARNLSRDHKALSELKMNCTAVHGLNFYEQKKIVHAIKSYPFSINIDKCSSNNHQKVFSILVSYFDEKLGLSVVQHYASVSMIEMNALTLFKKNCELF